MRGFLTLTQASVAFGNGAASGRSPPGGELGYLVEVFVGGPHLLPGLVQQLDADAEELLDGAVVREEHGVEVVAVLAGCGERTEHQAVPPNPPPPSEEKPPR